MAQVQSAHVQKTISIHVEFMALNDLHIQKQKWLMGGTVVSVG